MKNVKCALKIQGKHSRQYENKYLYTWKYKTVPDCIDTENLYSVEEWKSMYAFYESKCLFQVFDLLNLTLGCSCNH